MKTIIISLLLFSNISWGQRVNTSTSNTHLDAALPAPTKAEISMNQSDIIPKNLKVPEEMQKHMNPAYEEFWQEGNHRPDAGYVMLARNTNLDNAKLLLIRMEIKRKKMVKMQALLDQAQKELVLSGKIEDVYEQVIRKPKKNRKLFSGAEVKATPDDIKTLDYYFVFSPTCPHCLEMAKNLKGMPNVKPFQVGDGELKDFDGFAKTVRATPEELDMYAPDRTVPVLVIHDSKSNSILSVTGTKSKEEVLVAVGDLLKERKKI